MNLRLPGSPTTYQLERFIISLDLIYLQALVWTQLVAILPHRDFLPTGNILVKLPLSFYVGSSHLLPKMDALHSIFRFS
jgi:hypothetical protein